MYSCSVFYPFIFKDIISMVKYFAINCTEKLASDLHATLIKYVKCI